ncbi:TKL protein kinase [Saprolegnia parasitica CBS 223.65]|uniref:TKL protein kinase n=1 Tax=Saprolegnia parasitica (strain CBS 223.65) TaxID=695850 RepID=A0A067BXV3_SAPPC|nr:TKL protein kinase [Saprolegnia parasitica CBS 223.65]KDO19407.1 TKL protein kinase [Saprolegnia parasitica CBS 223.65]|eukprot:XP_012209874.1 TKL protein kinase [Saprolegnia parasitica CBS 223.65]
MSSGRSWQCLEHRGTDVAGRGFAKWAKAALNDAFDVMCISPSAVASSCAWFNTKTECAAVDPNGLATITCADYSTTKSGWCNDLRQQIMNGSAPMPITPTNNATESILPVLSNAWTCSTFAPTQVALTTIDAVAGVECLAASATECTWFPSSKDCWTHALQLTNGTGPGLRCAAVLKDPPPSPPSTTYRWCQSVLSSFANNTANATTLPPSTSGASLSTTTILLIVLACVVFIGSLAFFAHMRRQYHRSLSSSSLYDTPKQMLTIEYPSSETHADRPPGFDEPKESLVHDSLPPTAAVVNRPRDAGIAGSFSSGGSVRNDTILGISLDMGDLALWRLDETQLVHVKTLATGANGVVSLGLYKQTQHVAIKKQLGEITPESVQSFIDEIKLSSRLESPYIVQFIGASWVRPRNIEMIVEYMEGGDLRGLLLREPDTPQSWPKRKLQIALDVLDGLLYLHSMDIVHRDLKARNVLLTSSLRAKLTDFGVSRQVSDHGTMTMGVGTFRWTAPEVFRNQKYTVAADIYSFGMVLVELATHDVPYAQLTEMSNFALMQALRDGQHQPAPYRLEATGDCPDYVHALIVACTKDDPSARPSAMDVGSLLRQHLPAQYCL